jgi:hypothetical protein
MSIYSGYLIRLSDDRLVIKYHKQPLEGRIVLTLVDEKLNEIKDDQGRPKILIKDIAGFNKAMEDATVIGFID